MAGSRRRVESSAVARRPDVNGVVRGGVATLSILGDARAEHRQGVHVEDEATLSIPGEADRR